MTCTLTHCLIDHCPHIQKKTASLALVRCSLVNIEIVRLKAYVFIISSKPNLFIFSLSFRCFFFFSILFCCCCCGCCRSLPHDIMGRMFYLLLNIPAYYGETKSLFASGSLCCACPHFHLPSYGKAETFAVSIANVMSTATHYRK